MRQRLAAHAYCRVVGAIEAVHTQHSSTPLSYFATSGQGTPLMGMTRDFLVVMTDWDVNFDYDTSVGEGDDNDLSPLASISTRSKLPVEIIERILVHAIWLTSDPLNPIEVLFKWPLPSWFADPPTAAAPQLRQFLHVLPAAWAPLVTRAAFPRFLQCTPFYASYKGRVDLLDMRLQFDLDPTDIRSSLYLAT
ncbi:hypothetical protein GGF31_006662 [Allomyces arbusculus]|nr:hypothetical protein GGF31_006662 [Allomyces arbusculus]